MSKQTLNVYQCHQARPATVNLFQCYQTSVRRESKDLSDIKQFCKLICCNSCTFCKRAATKERHKSDCCKFASRIKIYEQCSCVDHLSSVKPVPNVQTVVQDLPEGARVHRFLGNLGSLGAGTKVIKMQKEGYTLPFWTLTKSPNVISWYVNHLGNL